MAKTVTKKRVTKPAKRDVPAFRSTWPKCSKHPEKPSVMMKRKRGNTDEYEHFCSDCFRRGYKPTVPVKTAAKPKKNVKIKRVVRRNK